MTRPPPKSTLSPHPTPSRSQQPQAAKAAIPVGTWRELVKHGVGEGRRNDAVARLAGHLLRREVDPLVAFEILATWNRSEEHTSELQSQSNLVCRLLLEKKKI